MPGLTPEQRAQIEKDLAELSPEQQGQYMDALEAQFADGPAQPQAAAGFERALAGADTIGEQPWYTRNLGPLPSVTQALAAGKEIGGAIGGILGGSGGTLAAPGAGSFAGAVKGAALGGAAGEAASQLGFRALGGDNVPRTGYDAARRIGLAGAEQAAYEVAGQGLARGATRLAAPFASNVDQAAVTAAQRQGVEMPASALSDSKWVPYAESVAAEAATGGAAAKRYTNAVSHLTAMADHTVARASRLTDDVARGEAIWSGFRQFKSTWIQTKNDLYRKVNDAMPHTDFVAPDTANLLESIVSQKRSAGKVVPAGALEDAAFYEGMLKKLTEKRGGVTKLRKLNASDVHEGIKALEHKIETAYADPVAQANQATLLKLQATLENEFMAMLKQRAPEAASRLEAANRVYADGLKKLNSTFGESIHKFAQQGKYDLIAKSIANPRMSVADIPRIMEVAGPEGADAMRAAVLANIVAGAKSGAGPDAVLTPRGLSKAMKAYGEERLQALLTPEQYAKLSDLTRLTGGLERAAKVANGSPTAGKARIMGYASAVPAAALGRFEVLLLVLGDLAGSKFLASKVGQRWMTTGYPLSGATQNSLRQLPRAVSAGVSMVQQGRRDAEQR